MDDLPCHISRSLPSWSYLFGIRASGQHVPSRILLFAHCLGAVARDSEAACQPSGRSQARWWLIASIRPWQDPPSKTRPPHERCIRVSNSFCKKVNGGGGLWTCLLEPIPCSPQPRRIDGPTTAERELEGFRRTFSVVPQIWLADNASHREKGIMAFNLRLLLVCVAATAALQPLVASDDASLGQARKEFPDLANPDSIFSRAYAAEEAPLRKTQPDFFTNENWPLMLAYRVAAKLGIDGSSAGTSSSRLQPSKTPNNSSTRGAANRVAGIDIPTNEEITSTVQQALGVTPSAAQDPQSYRYNQPQREFGISTLGTAYPKSRRKMREEKEWQRQQAFQTAIAAGPEETQRFLAREDQEKAQQALRNIQLQQTQLQQQMDQMRWEAQTRRDEELMRRNFP